MIAAMPAKPLHCKHCHGIFLPVSDQPWSAVQCPHCSGQMTVSECVPAATEPVPAGHDYVKVTEQEATAIRLEAVHNLWARRLVLAAVVILSAGAGIFFWQRNTARGPGTADALIAGDIAAQVEKQQIQKVVAGFLGAPDWKSMLPLVVDADRVAEDMVWYYQRAGHRHVPASATEVGAIEPVEADGVRMLRVRASTELQSTIWLLLRKESGGWKIDWESFSNAAVERWRAFIREPANSSVELRLLVARKPAADAYLMKHGATPDATEAVSVWAFDRQAVAASLIPRDAALWKMLEGIDFENAVKIIARVTMLDPMTEPPLVRIDEIIQRGWLWGAPAPLGGTR